MAPQLAPFGMPCLTDPVCRVLRPIDPSPGKVARRDFAGGVLAELATHRRQA